MQAKIIYPQKIYIESQNDKDFLNNINNSGDNISTYPQKLGFWASINLSQTKNIYIVKPLDTLEKIAKKLNLSEDYLKTCINSKNIFIGQKITF